MWDVGLYDLDIVCVNSSKSIDLFNFVVVHGSTFIFDLISVVYSIGASRLSHFCHLVYCGECLYVGFTY